VGGDQIDWHQIDLSHPYTASFQKVGLLIWLVSRGMARADLAVRIEPALRAALEAAAASDRRPVSQYVRNLILDAVDGERERQVERVNR
jgi:hypothetical protein